MSIPPLSLLLKIQEALLKRKETVASAESCTGGLVAAALTHLPGSSGVYWGGVNAYSNRVKIDLLGVPGILIDNLGAVSAEVAEAMARGVRDKIKATYGVSITGVAGPAGGSAAKPVGTVFCGIAGPGNVRHLRWRLAGDREGIRDNATQQALEELLAEINRGAS